MADYDLEGDKKKMRERSTTILVLVEGLEGELTSEDDALRCQGVNHLAEVIKGCPEALRSQEDIAVLAAFFVDKFSDRACIGAALKGCLALLSAEQPLAQGVTASAGGPTTAAHNQGVTTSAADSATAPHARLMAEALFRDVPTQALSQPNREACLQLLLRLIKEHGEQLVGEGVDLIQGTVAAVDGERDPRCLLLVFEAVRCLGHLYSTSAAEAQQAVLRSKSEDLCDVIACYFPITFRLQPNSQHSITRDNLSSALEAAMCCTPLFAPYLVPLQLDKLSSSLWQAKVDALSALAACLEAWGPASKPYLSRLWPSLRNELTDATEPSPGEADIAKPAAECLRRCIAALEAPSQQGGAGIWSLLTEVLSSEAVADVPQWLLESSSGEAASLAKQVATAALILKTVASASVSASQQVCRTFMSTLLSTVNAGEATPAALALSVILSILQGAKASVKCAQGSALAGAAGSAEAEVPLLDWGPKLLQAALLAGGPPSSAEEGRSEFREQKDGLQRLQVVACLATFPAGNQLSPLGSEDHAAAIQFLLTNATSPNANQLSADATRAIAETIEAGHERAIAEHLSSILKASSHLSPEASSWTGQPALDCIVAICKASAALRTEVFQRLTENLPGWLEAHSGTEAGRQLLLAHIAALSIDILPACTQPFTGPDAAAASKLAQTLIAAVHAFSLGSRGEAVQSIAPACATAVQVATAGCEAGAQEAIATCAWGVLARTVPKAAGQAVAEQAEQAEAANRSVEAAASMVACAALIGLRPGVNQQHLKALYGEQQATDLLRAVLSVALTAKREEHAQVAMAAAASLLAKWPAGSGPQSIDDAVSIALDEVVLPRLQLQLKGDSQHVRLRAVGLLGWLARGLAMRGHPRAGKPLDTALAYLEAASLDLATAQEEAAAAAAAAQAANTADPGTLHTAAQAASAAMEGVEQPGTAPGVPGSRSGEDEDALEGWEDAFDADEARAMAGVFETVLSERPGLARLDDSTHARGRILWKQKVFTEAVKGLQEKLQEGVDFLGSPPAPLLLGLARLLEGAPKEVLKGALPKLLPWLLSALQALSEGLLVDGPALTAILWALADALAEEAGRKALEEHVSQLVPALLTDVAFPSDAGVRSAALRCLAATMQLPYPILHPHRSAVLKALAVAVDDPKRVIRTQAARCRQAWLT